MTDMSDTAALMLGMLFGSVGLGFFVYGRRQRNPVSLATGVALMIYPFFVSNSLLIVLIGAALCAAPYFIRY